AFTSVLNNATLSAIQIAPITPTEAPAAPTNLLATGISGSKIKLTWTDNADAETGYKIERQTAGGDWTEIATVGSNDTTYTDASGLAYLTSYNYRVRATNAIGDSDYTAVATGRTLAPITTWKT